MKNALYLDLLLAVGLGFDSAGRLIDTDSLVPIIFNGRRIISLDNNTLRHFNDIDFDPLANNKLCDYILAIATAKLAEEDNVHVMVLRQDSRFSKQYNGKKIFKFSQIATTTESEIQSDFYYNMNLATIDLIFKLNHYPITYDLSGLDRNYEV